MQRHLGNFQCQERNSIPTVLSLLLSWIHHGDGASHRMHDGGFTKTAEYSKRLKLSQGLSVEVYKNNKRERFGIKYINVTITKADG